MDVTVELHCDRCGSANLSVPPDQEASAHIRCNDCGQAHGTITELARDLMACARQHSAEALRRNLDRLS